jgi:hypothetical protein
MVVWTVQLDGVVQWTVEWSVEWSVQWTVRGLLRTADAPGTSEIRRECWSRGRIVSALLDGAAGGCLPSVEPPNSDAFTIGWPARLSKACRLIDISLHRSQQHLMKTLRGAAARLLSAVNVLLGFVHPGMMNMIQGSGGLLDRYANSADLSALSQDVLEHAWRA